MDWVIHHTDWEDPGSQIEKLVLLNYCLNGEKKMQKVLRMLFVRSWKSCSQQTGQTMAMQSASHAPKGQSLIHGMAEECPGPVASEDRELPFDLRWWARDIIFLCTWRLSWLVVVLGWLLLVRMILLVGSEGVFLYIFPLYYLWFF